MKKFALLSMLLGLGLFAVGCSENKPSKPAAPAPATDTPPADTGAPADATDPAAGAPANNEEMPADEPADKPADEPADKPADEPADKPADEPADKPADEAPADENK